MTCCVRERVLYPRKRFGLARSVACRGGVGLDGYNYQIPDDDVSKWIKTNPEIHAEKATAAHHAFSREWKGLVRMVKYWNNNPHHCGYVKAIAPA